MAIWPDRVALEDDGAGEAVTGGGVGVIRGLEVQPVFAGSVRCLSEIEDDRVAQREVINAVAIETVGRRVLDGDEVKFNVRYVRQRDTVRTGALNRAAGARLRGRSAGAAVARHF